MNGRLPMNDRPNKALEIYIRKDNTKDSNLLSWISNLSNHRRDIDNTARVVPDSLRLLLSLKTQYHGT